jgi:hypothetical protein
MKISWNFKQWSWAMPIVLPIVAFVTTGSVGMAIVGLCFGASVGVFLSFTRFVYPEVLLEKGSLIIRDGGPDQVIPFTSIRSVSESRWSRTKTITVEFETSAGKLDRVVFIPDFPINLPMSHPMV